MPKHLQKSLWIVALALLCSCTTPKHVPAESSSAVTSSQNPVSSTSLSSGSSSKTSSSSGGSVTKVVLSGPQTVAVGESILISASTSVTFTSADPAIATITSNGGLVTGVKAGTVLMNAVSTSNSAAFASMSITVTSQSDQITASLTDSAVTYEAVDKAAKLYGTGAEISAPTSGDVHFLVLPVNIAGTKSTYPYWSASMLSDLNDSIFGDASDTGWESLKSFYAASSYGNLNIVGKVADPYEGGTSLSTVGTSGPDDLINAAVANYESNNTDYLDYDANHDGYLDAIMVIYNVKDYSKVSSLSQTFWAFTSNLENSPSTAKPKGNKYFWASYDFMYDGYGSKVDAHTFIHESGHMLGLDDYYSYDGQNGGTDIAPMGDIDMMDNNIIDHDAYSKFALGWEGAQVVSGTGGSLQMTLAPAADYGNQCVLLPTSKGWNETAFDEYLLLEYYTPTGMNKSDSVSPYPGNYLQGFTSSGLRIYHVDARLYDVSSASTDSQGYISSFTGSYVSRKGSAVLSGTSAAYGVQMAHSNSVSRSYVNTNYRLIQELDSSSSKRNFASAHYTANNATLFTAGESFSFSSYGSEFVSSSAMNNGGTLKYTVKVVACSSLGATITIAYNA
jgi:M6 family metalloprotease-like protein